MGEPQGAQLGDGHGIGCYSKGKRNCAERVNVHDVVSDSTNSRSERIGREADIGRKECCERDPPDEAVTQKKVEYASSHEYKRTLDALPDHRFIHRGFSASSGTIHEALWVEIVSFSVSGRRHFPVSLKPTDQIPPQALCPEDSAQSTPPFR